METQFLAVFLLFEKGTATSIFDNSPALYRNICSTCVQILGNLSSLCNHVTLYGLASPRLLHSLNDHIKSSHSFKHGCNNGR